MVPVTKHGEEILTGTRDPKQNLCMVFIHDNPSSILPRPHSFNYTNTTANSYQMEKAALQIAFLHACANYSTS